MGRMWAAMSERKGLGTAGFSINPTRTGGLEAIMGSALVTRTAMIAMLARPLTATVA